MSIDLSRLMKLGEWLIHRWDWLLLIVVFILYVMFVRWYVGGKW